MWKKLALGLGLTAVGEKIYEKNKDVIDPVAKAGVDATRKALKTSVKLAKNAYDKYNEPVKESAKKVYQKAKEGVEKTKQSLETEDESDKGDK